MPPFISSSKAIHSFLTRNKFANQLINSSKNHHQSSSHQIRRFSTISGINSAINSRRDVGFTLGASLYNDTDNRSSCVAFLQKRRFLGCGDGDEGGVLSKVYEERIVLGYSPEQLFDVVAAVDLYHGFVPWCQRSEILRYNPDGSFEAELEIGFKFLVESYVSHVELSRPKFVKTTVSDSTLFDHLINTWEFNPGPVPGTCDLYFLVDFKFQSPLYRQLASVFFKEVVSQLVGSFSERCQLVYGPAVPITQNSYEQKHKEAFSRCT